MTEKETQPNQAADLRRLAEEIARKNVDQTPENLLAMSHEETRHALHELRVHQIELEIQNRELRQSQEELDVARAKYFELYDLAPVGYVTFSEKGLILEANFTTATLLGFTRGELVKAPFSRFIINEDQGIYFQFRKQLFETGEPQACELRMIKKERPAFWVNLEATVAQHPSAGSGQAGGPVCHIAMSDITDRKQSEKALQEAHDLLELRVAERTGELWTSNETLRAEITTRKQAEEALSAQSQQLEETNTALKVLLRHREEELRELEKKVVVNIQKLVLPHIAGLKQLRLGPDQSSHVDIIDANLQQVINPFLQNLAACFSVFTPREIQIANLIKQGKTSKEIAALVKAAPRSVEFHRNNIRRKLGLGGKKTSLRSFLLTLS